MSLSVGELSSLFMVCLQVVALVSVVILSLDAEIACICFLQLVKVLLAVILVYLDSIRKY